MARILIRDLVPNMGYVAQVRATSGTNVSDWSRIFTFFTEQDNIAPAAPTDLTFVFNGSSAIASWTAPSLDELGNDLNDFKEFEVRIFTPGASANASVYKTTTITFEFTKEMNDEVFSGTPQGILVAEVRAIDATGNISDPATATATNAPPSAPTGVTGNLVQDGVRITWTASPDKDLKYYEIWSASTAGAVGTRSGTVSPATTEYLHYTVAYTTDHYLYVKAVDEFNLSSPESNRTGPHRPNSPFTVDTAAPAATTLTTATPTRATSEPAAVTLTWPVVNDSDLAGYHVRFSRVTTPRSWEFHDVIDKTATTATISGLISDTAYVFQIRSYDTMINTSAWSAEVTGTSSVSEVPPMTEISSDISVITGGALRSANYDEAAGTGWRLIHSGLDIQSGAVNARVIKAGTMFSTQNVTHDGTTQPAWSLNLAGNASLNDVQVRGKIVVGNAAGTTNGNVSVASYNYGGSGAQWAIKGDGTFDIKSGTGARVQVSSAGITANNGTIDTVNIQTNGNFNLRTGSNGVVFDQTGLKVTTGTGAVVAQFDNLGNATFKGDITGATGTFSGTLSANTLIGGTVRSSNTPGGANSWQIDNTYALRVWNGSGTQTVYIDNTGYAEFTNANVKGNVDAVLFTSRGTKGYKIEIGATGTADPVDEIRFFNNGTTASIRNPSAYLGALVVSTSSGQTFHFTPSNGLMTNGAEVRTGGGLLHLSGGDIYGANFIRSNDSSSTRIGMSSTGIDLYISTNSTRAFSFNNVSSTHGSLRFGSTGPSMKFLTNGTMQVWDYNETAYATLRAVIDNVSSIQYKTDVVNYEDSAVAKVKGTRVTKFRQLEGTTPEGAKVFETKPTIGLIVEEMPPEMVTEDGQAYRVGAVIGVLWKAVQELEAQIAELRRRPDLSQKT